MSYMTIFAGMILFGTGMNDKRGYIKDRFKGGTVQGYDQSPSSIKKTNLLIRLYTYRSRKESHFQSDNWE